jgi:hypothetical protein
MEHYDDIRAGPSTSSRPPGSPLRDTCKTDRDCELRCANSMTDSEKMHFYNLNIGINGDFESFLMTIAVLWRARVIAT